MTLEPIEAYEEGEFANVPLGLCRPHIVNDGTTLPGRSRYLLLFRHRYLDFRLAEVQSLAEISYGKQGFISRIFHKIFLSFPVLSV
jgi:hypothetical protein